MNEWGKIVLLASMIVSLSAPAVAFQLAQGKAPDNTRPDRQRKEIFLSDGLEIPVLTQALQKECGPKAKGAAILLVERQIRFQPAVDGYIVKFRCYE